MLTTAKAYSVDVYSTCEHIIGLGAIIGVVIETETLT